MFLMMFQHQDFDFCDQKNIRKRGTGVVMSTTFVLLLYRQIAERIIHYVMFCLPFLSQSRIVIISCGNKINQVTLLLNIFNAGASDIFSVLKDLMAEFACFSPFATKHVTYIIAYPFLKHA